MSSRFRRLVLSALMVFAPLVATAAAAWACTPSAQLRLDKPSPATYEAGSTITANGFGFPAYSAVSVTLGHGGLGDTGPPISTTTVDASEMGAISTTLEAPMEPGNYTLTATHPAGGFAPAAFTVIAAPPPPPPPPPPPSPPPPADVPTPVTPTPITPTPVTPTPVTPAPVSPAPVPVSVAPEPAPALPAPVLAPDLAGPALLRQARPNETVLVSRTGIVEVFCGRLDTGQVRGSCGAASTRRQSSGTAPLVELRPKAFRSDAGGRVVIRFHLKARALRAVKAAKRIRMRGTVVAVGANGTTTTKSFGFTLKAPRAMRR